MSEDADVGMGPADLQGEAGTEQEQATESAERAVVPVEKLVAHSFPAQEATEVRVTEEDDEYDEELEKWREDLWLYRNRTQMMLRRYARLRMETGKVPSIMAREFFRSGVSTYTVGTFEDRVIFVCDMERCLDRLDDWSRELVELVVLQEHGQDDIGGRYGCTGRHIYRQLEDALDKLSTILVGRGLLR